VVHFSRVPTPHPRIQVTVDGELAEALDYVDPHPQSRSRLIRELALRGAAATRAERERQEASRAFLLSVVRGETEYDPSAAADIHAEREASLE
jgi:metal-responsive CopG/Arc/MetJ family transcriptional regulator